MTEGTTLEHDVIRRAITHGVWRLPDKKYEPEFMCNDMANPEIN